jgi:hypothetical protein
VRRVNALLALMRRYNTFFSARESRV